MAGDTIHLLHVVPEPSMIHVWPGMYVPPDDTAEHEEVGPKKVLKILSHYQGLLQCLTGLFAETVVVHQVDDAVRMIRKRFTSHFKSAKIPCQVNADILPFLHTQLRAVL